MCTRAFSVARLGALIALTAWIVVLGLSDAGIADALLVALVALPVALWLSACGWMIERDGSAMSQGGTLFTVMSALLVAITIAAAAVLGTRAVISTIMVLGALLCAGALSTKSPALGALSAILLAGYVASGMWITGRAFGLLGLPCWRLVTRWSRAPHAPASQQHRGLRRVGACRGPRDRRPRVSRALSSLA